MKNISNQELDKKFDNGEDITAHMDMSTITRPNHKPSARRISMDITEEMVRGLDRYAQRMGVNRQAVIKIWLGERLDEEAQKERLRVA